MPLIKRERQAWAIVYTNKGERLVDFRGPVFNRSEVIEMFCSNLRPELDIFFDGVPRETAVRNAWRFLKVERRARCIRVTMNLTGFDPVE